MASQISEIMSVSPNNTKNKANQKLYAASIRNGDNKDLFQYHGQLLSSNQSKQAAQLVEASAFGQANTPGTDKHGLGNNVDAH